MTPGTQTSAEQLLKKAGLTDYCERILSVETVERFKPAPEAYWFAADQLQVPLSQLCLVAAHAWASAVGCQTAFLQQPGQGLNPNGSKPDWQATDLLELARQL